MNIPINHLRTLIKFMEDFNIKDIPLDHVENVLHEISLLDNTVEYDFDYAVFNYIVDSNIVV